MKLLITGGTGLVGTGIKSIASEFPELDISYMSSKDCNLLDYDQVLEYFWNEEPECIIHLAANVGGLYKNMNQKVEMFDDNIQMNLNVIKAAFSNDIKNLIGTLSTCIFPDNTTYPINETMLHDGAPHTSNDAYAYAKRMIKVQCVRKLLREDLARPGRVGAQRRSRARHAARGAGRSAGFRVSKGSLGPNLDEGPADPTRLHACTIVCKTPGRAQSPSLAIEQLSIAPGQQARKSGSMPVPNSNLYGGTTRKASVYT